MWERLALGLLWLGHGVWVFLGPTPGRHWTSLADALSRPSQNLASRWAGWRASRREAGRAFGEMLELGFHYDRYLYWLPWLLPELQAAQVRVPGARP